MKNIRLFIFSVTILAVQLQAHDTKKTTYSLLYEIYNCAASGAKGVAVAAVATPCTKGFYAVYPLFKLADLTVKKLFLATSSAHSFSGKSRKQLAKETAAAEFAYYGSQAVVSTCLALEMHSKLDRHEKLRDLCFCVNTRVLCQVRGLSAELSNNYYEELCPSDRSLNLFHGSVDGSDSDSERSDARTCNRRGSERKILSPMARDGQVPGLPARSSDNYYGDPYSMNHCDWGGPYGRSLDGSDSENEGRDTQATNPEAYAKYATRLNPTPQEQSEIKKLEEGRARG